MKLRLPKTLLTAVVAALMIPAEYAYASDLSNGEDLRLGENVLTENVTFNKGQTLTGDVTINGRGYAEKWGGYPPGYSLTLGTGANVTVTGNLDVTSQCHLKITDGFLSSTGEFRFGHPNSGEKNHPADLEMTGGNLSVSKIIFLHKEDANRISIKGGTLTITGETAITQDSNHDYNSTVFIGGEEGRIVTLKTGGTNNAKFDYSKLTLGNVTIEAADDHSITINNATLTGTITNSGGADKLKLGNATIEANTDQTVTITSATLTGSINNLATADKLQLGEIKIAADTTDAITISNATLTGSINNLAGADKLQLGSVTVAADITDAITITNATLNESITNLAGDGKLILSGTNALNSDLVKITDGHYYNADGTETSGNGYLGATYTANIGNNLTLADGATFTVGEHTLTNLTYDETAGAYTTTFTDTGTYYVRTNTNYTEGLTSATNICVTDGATLDAKGNAIEFKTIILQEGATLANTGAVIGNDKRQNSHITLEGNATLDAASSMGIIGSGYETSYLELNNHTLNKTGAGTLTLINTDISAGTVDIQQGEVVLRSQGSHAIASHGTVFNVGKTGQLTFDNFGGADAGNIILNATGTGTINVSTNTTITGRTGDTPATSAFAGTVNVTGGTLSIGSNTSNHNDGWKVKAENMDINLNGGNVYYFGFNSALGNLTVEENAIYTIHATEAGESYNNKVAHQVLNIATGATLHLKSNWQGTASFAELTGQGHLSLENGDHDKYMKVSIEKVNFEGNITQTSLPILTVTNVARAGNIVNNGGTMTLDSITSSGVISNTGGTLTIGKDNTSAVHLGSTIVNTGTLNLNGRLTAADNGSYEVASAGGIRYSEGGENGFQITEGDTLYLVKGGTINLTEGYTFQYGNTSSSLTQTDAGLTFTEAGEIGSVFFVRNGTVDEQALLTGNKVTGGTAYSIEGGTFQAAGDISNNRLNYTGGTLNVSQGHKLTIDTARDDAASLLLNTAGEGNIEINNATTVTLAGDSATKLTGDLIVSQGSTLELVESADAATPTAADFSSLKKLTLNGALRIAVDEVTVKGITGDSGAIYSGEQASGTADTFAGDGTNRTLIIDTGAGGDHGTTATLGDHLNLTKRGAGSQTFAGVAPSAIGQVKVEAGSLAFSNLTTLNVTELTIQKGATLSVGSTVQAAAEGDTPFNGVRVSNSATLEGGATINSGLDLTSTQTLTVNNIENGSITLSGTLILPTGGSIALSGDLLDTLAGLGKGDSLALFTGVTSLALGSTSYTELEASDASDLSRYFNFDGLEQGSYQLGYANGVVSVHSLIPEPTTATLSLLALAGLAARRRRR